MIYLTVLLVLVIVWREHQHQQQTQQAAEHATRERQVLLDRIQHPERPTLTPLSVVLPDPEPDESELVGTIQHLEPE